MNRGARVNVPRQLRDELGNVGVAAAGHDLPRRLRISESRPWLSKKRMSVSAGNDRIASSEADQMADAMGNRYRWVKPSPKRRDSRKSPSVWRSASGARAAPALPD